MNIFSRFKGLTFRRKRAQSAKIGAPQTPVRTIEFIGPSGIGKSTFCRAYQEVSPISWCPVGQIFGLPLISGEAELDGGIHWKILSKKFDFWETHPLNGFRKVKLMNYFAQVIQQDLSLYYNSEYSFFLLEEGICHNFASEILELNDSDFLSIMKGRALVYVRTSNPDLVVERIKKREKETGFMVTHHVGLDYYGLLKIAEQSLYHFGKLTDRLSGFGLPYCILDAEHSVAEAQEVCLEFERKIKPSL